ncbi:MAG: type II secretion system F family protein [Myxococcales bacterium]|nr:type II secretion system F family protein [Myxococcales bacterium]MCB9707398.1 type II secretion system F family protein [Myxococcales bacterium]
MKFTSATWPLLYGGLVLSGIALAIVAYGLLLNPQSPVRVQWRRYCHYLDTYLRFVRQKLTGRQLAVGQMLVLALWCGLVLAAGLPLLLFVGVLFLFIPSVWLQQLQRKRIQQLGEQLDGWLQALANALKASSSLGDAIESTQSLLHSPMSDEVEILIKETRLGTPLDAALRNMARRLKSRTISSALVTLLVARQSGGNLPHTLERSAAALREMARLEGVVRTKTAESKAQAYVLAVMPAVVVFAVNWIHPDLLIPLRETMIGNAVAVLAAVLWILSVVLTNRILRVDM